MAQVQVQRRSQENIFFSEVAENFCRDLKKRIENKIGAQGLSEHRDAVVKIIVTYLENNKRIVNSKVSRKNKTITCESLIQDILTYIGKEFSNGSFNDKADDRYKKYTEMKREKNLTRRYGVKRVAGMGY